jgi:hypothetical protein
MTHMKIIQNRQSRRTGVAFSDSIDVALNGTEGKGNRRGETQASTQCTAVLKHDIVRAGDSNILDEIVM